MPTVPGGPGTHWLRSALDPSFPVEVGTAGGTVRLRLTGELDVACAAALHAAFDEARRAAGGHLIVLDLGEVELLSLAAARVLMAAEHGHRDEGGRVVVQHLPATVRRFLELAGLHHAFEIIDPVPGVVTRSRPAGGDLVLVEGTVSPATVSDLEHRISHTPRTAARRLTVDLGSATVPTGAVTVALCSTLRRLCRPERPLVVVGAPPAVELILSLSADGVELPDRQQA